MLSVSCSLTRGQKETARTSWIRWLKRLLDDLKLQNLRVTGEISDLSGMVWYTRVTDHSGNC